MKNIKFLHVFGPDTKNSYGIMSQLHKTCDLNKHKFLITAYSSCKTRFPKLEEFPDLIFIPEAGGRFERMVFFYKILSESEIIIWHSLYFTTPKYTYFLYMFRKFLNKSVWIEWGADLYLWKYSEKSWKGRLKNKVNKTLREKFRIVGCTFPVDEIEVYHQFGSQVRCFYTPLPNPMKEATGLIDLIISCKPKNENEDSTRIQIAHNSFQFNNHIKIIELLKRYKDNNVRFILPLSYGIYGINGQYGGKLYRDAVIKYAKENLDNKVTILYKNMDFQRYIRFLWKIDIAVFDFDRPCGLGTLRILLLMEKKIFLPSGTPYYNFLISQGLPICDTNKISEMTFEEFIKPVKYTTNKWVLSYMNNDEVIKEWSHMFRELESNINKERGKAN
jgi:hypothetical protein